MQAIDSLFFRTRSLCLLLLSFFVIHLLFTSIGLGNRKETLLRELCLIPLNIAINIVLVASNEILHFTLLCVVHGRCEMRSTNVILGEIIVIQDFFYQLLVPFTLERFSHRPH
jgi:hypothetical protein